MLDNAKGRYEAIINGLINQPVEDTISILDEPDSVYLTLDYDLLKEKISNHHPLILSLQHMEEVSKSKQGLIQNQQRPNISLGLDYSLVNQRTDANPQFNGRDILIPKIMISIPHFKQKLSFCTG